MAPSNPHQSTEVNQSDSSPTADARTLRPNRPFGVYAILLMAAFSAYICFENALPHLAKVTSLEPPLWYRAFLAANLLAGGANLFAVYQLWGLRRWAAFVAFASLSATIAVEGWLEFIRYDLEIVSRAEAIDSFSITILMFVGFILYILTPKFRIYFSRSTDAAPHSRNSPCTRRTPGVEICTFAVIFLGLIGIVHSWKYISESTTYFPLLDITTSIISFVISILYFSLAHGLWNLQLWARSLAKFVFITEIVLGLLLLLFISTRISSVLETFKDLILFNIIIFGILLAYITSRKVKRLLT
jgi:hypothetical protein